MAEASPDGGDDEIRDDIRVPQQVLDLLNYYPDDPQILKEFIQKADDAKATEIKILYEGRNLNLPQKGEGDSPLRKFCKAPALCIYYDAYFTEEDWKEMQMFGDSVLNEPFNVGKFGMGFMSAFHLTDYPMIISKDKVFFINRQEANGVRIIKLQNLKESKEFMKSINGTFGFNKQNILEGRFEGTLLWFSLRKEQSVLSKNKYRNDNKIDALLKAFMTESQQMLLFLKYIRRIRLYVNLSKKDKDKTTLGTYNHGKREEFFTVEITNDEYLQSRLSFAEALQKRSCETVIQEFTPFCGEVSIRVTELDKDDREYNYIVMFFIMTERDASAYLEHLPDDTVLPSIPLVGIAAPLCQKSIEEVERRGGHIFCYQPLPQTPDNNIKGLPVHIHAPFALNRREMTLASNMERNRTLIEEVLPEAYCEFIKYLVKRSSGGNNKDADVDLVYRSIPNETSETWQPLRNGLLRKLLQEDILFTEIGLGKWIKYTEADVASEIETTNEHIQCVFMLLKSDKVNVVLLPDHVRVRLGKIFSDSIQRLSPLFICQHMKTNHSYNNLDHHQKDSLLVYLAEGGDQLLNGIKLLPLSDGTYTSFMDGTDEYSHVFVEPHSTVSLFPDLGSRFVSTEVSSTFDRMKTFAKKKKYQLMQLSWTSLVQCLVESVQCRFGSCTQITSAQLQGHIWSTQIKQLWKLIGQYFPVDGNSNETMDMFKHLPLFPLGETDGDAGRQYLNALNDIYLVCENPVVLTSNVLKAFDQLGVRVIDKIPSFVNDVIKNSKDIIEFFHTCSGDRIDALLSRLSETNVEKFNTMASADANYEEHHLVEFLSSTLEKEESLKSTDVIRRIRIWQQFKSPLNPDEALVSLEQNNAIWTDRTFPVCFDEPMIITEHSHFAKRLGAREISVMEMCVSRLNHIATLNDKDLHLFIDWLLDKELFLNNEDIKKFAMETEVVQKMLDHLEYISRNYSLSGKINLEHVTKIYRWLNDNSDLKFVKSYLDQLYETNEVGCVWTGDGFNAAGTVIADQMPNLRNYAPFLNRIAREHADLTSFFIAIGCIDSVTPDTYVKSLSRIKDASERANSNVTNEDMRSMSIDILNTLQCEYDSEQLNGIRPIYVPIATEDDASFQMREANECTYHEPEWHDDEEAIVYAHRDVPLKTAQSVGVWSVTQRLLTECEGFEAREQPKPLTQTIYELLNKNYVGEFTIVEKLFQNAEHASVSCMQILYDERGNENFRDNLLSPEMEEMQGPALWIHYDACFSDEDFENIINLNGQFGLDFCSVYNLTDVPSILSRSKLVIFDPNMRFLQQAFPGKTGVIIDFERERNQKLIAKCKNQFQPFQNICNCDIVTSKKPYYQGTLLRLPLRTRPSEVSENIYTRDKMQNLLKTIEKVAANMFIFTKNINRLEVLRIPNLADPASGCKLSFVVTCNREEYLLVRGLIQSLHEFNSENRFQSAPTKTVIELHIETTKWTAASCSPPIKSTWFVSWFTPTDTTALSTVYSEYDRIPLGGVAVAVQLNKDGSVMNISNLPEGLSNNSQVFCVHPLPVMHSLQFHINGPFKITGERSFLQGYAKDDSGNSFDKWNVHLLQDPVTEALVFLIEVLNLYRRKKYNFFSLWPLQENDTISQIVAESFYRKIIRRGNKFFKGQKTLSDFSQCLFLDPKLQERDPKIAELAVKVILKFENRRTFVDLPPKYYSQMLSVEEEMTSKVTINASKFLLRYFLPKVEALLGFLESETITSILVFAVQQEDREVDYWLKDNDSIPTKPKGKMVCPKRIIHPSSKLACLFSEEEERFPKEEFVSLNKQLERLGMRMNDLDNNDVVERAKTISLLNKNCSECARKRQEKFVEYLESHIDVNKDAIQEVQQIECIPVLQKPRDWSFHWKFGSEPPPHRERMTTRNCSHLLNTLMHFHRPVDLYAKHMTNLVGCFGFIAASSYGNLESELKLQVQISTENIVKQLDILTETCNPSSDISKTTEIVTEIYRELDKRCTNQTDKDIIEKSLKDKRVVFASNTFVKPENIALNCTSLGTINCAPYLYRVEDSPLCHFPALCSCLHIQKRFSSDVVERAIGDIYRSHGDTPLDDDLFAKTVALLEYLSDCVQKTKGSGTLNVYVPDKKKILREVHELVFDDKFESCTSGETDFIFAHGRITAAMANSFGIISRLNKHLRAQCIGNSTQGEPLVKMINDILHVHPSDVDIFKELIRNADDAGATEIHFVNDKMRHSSNSSLDWAQELQGPALCIYRDKGFSANDLKDITHLGRVSESENLFANEQHGMGFNALFNLTDVPSFMTTVDKKEVLCLLDPLAKHVPGIFNGKQGILYNNLKLLRKVAPDIVKGYHEGQLRKGCKGTVFRFPLRQKESELSHTKITSEMIAKLFQQFQEELPQVLIFMKNLEKVSLFEHVETGFKKICCVETQLSKKAKRKRRIFLDQYNKFRNDVQSDITLMLSSEQKMQSYTFNVLKDSQPLMSVQVVSAVGFKEPLNISNSITDTIKENRICLFPVGGVAFCTEELDNSDLCHLQKSRAFCFLPLDEETGLSVHVNGHFALDPTTRRGLWKSPQEGEDEYVQFQWNMAIINRVIVPTYVRLIQLWRKRYFANPRGIKECLNQYESLLPCTTNVKEKYWEGLTKSLYKDLVKTKDPFAPYVANTRSNTQTRDQLKWIPLQTKDDNDMSLIAFYQPLNSNSRDVAPILSLIGMQVFNFSEAIATSLQWAGFDVKAVNPATVIDFLKSYTSSDKGSCNMKVDCRIEDSTLHSSENLKKITVFCSGDNDYMAANIQNLPIVMTQDKRLVKVDETKKLYVSKYVEELFRNFGELHSRFIHHSLYDEYISISYKTDYIKVLDIQDFVIICKENKIFDTQSAAVRRWNRDPATAKWIKHVFTLVMDSTQNKNKDSVLRSILLLQELSVVPVEENNVKFLYPASDVPYILSSELNGNDSLKHVLSKCNIPTIDKSVFLTNDDDRSGNSESTYQLLCLAMPDFSRPKDMLHCLIKNIELIRTASLDVTDSKAILTYATDNIKELSSETDGEMRDILKALPIFLKVDGTLTHIDGRKVIVSLKDDRLPYRDLEYLQDTLFLQCDHSERALYDYLGFSPKPIVNIYVDDIFQNHMSMTREGFYYHVKFVLKHYKNWEQGNEIRGCLESVAFIGKNNQFRTVGQVFDPKHKVFEVFCSEDELLPKDLQDEALTNEYLTLGFQDKMTIELLIRFAKQLGNDGHPMSCEKRSKILCDELRDLLSMEIDVKLLKCLGAIKFLIAESVEEEFSSICPGIHEGELTSFSESVLYSKRALCWTTCSLLPKYVDTLLQGIQNHEYIQDNLCIKCKPTVPELIKHCKNIGECFKTKNVIFPKGLWESIYSEFKEYMKDSCNQFPDQKELENIPLVFFPDKNLLAPAANVVIDCKETEEIMPYLNRAPTHFETFHDVFVKLGASSNIHASNYARVLTELARNVRSPMLPEEKELSIKATKGLIFRLKSDSKKIPFDSMFLPSDKNTMEPATCIVVCDNLSLMERLGDKLPTNLKYLTKWEELSEKPEIIVERMKLLSGDSAPRMLSSLVKEKVMTDDIKQQNYERARVIMNFLRCHEFIEGILRIINHTFKGTEKEWDEYTIKIQTTLLNIKLRHVRGLKSELQIRNVDNEEYIGIVGTEEDVHAYVVPEGNLTEILFQDSNKYWYSHLKDTLARHLADSLHKVVTFDLADFTLLYTMLDKEYLKNPQAITAFLDKHKRKMYTLSPDARLKHSPSPGMDVPRDYFQYLSNDYGDINEGDFQMVAYEKAEDSMGTNNEENTFETYLFARICKKESTSIHCLFQRYEVDIGEEMPISAPGHRIYTFRREDTAAVSSGSETNSDQQLLLFTQKYPATDIRLILKTAWGLQEEEERIFVVKRLLLKWRPDRNLGNEEYCSKVFRYIQQCILRLEKGQSLENDTEDDWSNQHENRQVCKAACKFTKGFKRSNYGSFSKNWQHYQHGRNSLPNRTIFWTEKEYKPCPNSAVARDWIRQASEDIKKAKDYPNELGYNLVCYLSHQAAEKTLTAAWYAKDAIEAYEKQYNHNLMSLASGLDPNLSQLCLDLESISAVTNRTVGERFTKEDAENAVSYAENLLSEVKRIFNLYE